MNKFSTVQTGIPGEYFVAAGLSRRSYVATITLRNTRDIDILASNADATKSVGIQVKTCRGTKPDWILNKKAEADLAQNLFYVFVCLPPEDEPVFYVVPRKAVAEYVRDSHRRWLATPGRHGEEHNDSDMRRFKDPDGKYKGKWKSIG